MTQLHTGVYVDEDQDMKTPPTVFWCCPRKDGDEDVRLGPPPLAQICLISYFALEQDVRW